MIELLYGAIAARDGAAAAGCYSPNARFSDPVFPDLRDGEPGAMCASLRFADGLIVEHHDEFNFYRWARQALGTVGLLFGWTPLIRAAVRRRARASLDAFVAGGPLNPRSLRKRGTPDLKIS